MRSRDSIAFLILSFLLVLAPIAGAQTTVTSVLLGSVEDPQGGAVARATITAIELSRNYSTKTTSNADGSYRIEGLLPGNYQLRVTMNGFQTFVNNEVILYARQERRVDVRLQLGSVSEEITVKEQGSVIDTENATHSTTQSALEIHDFPAGIRGPINGGVDGSPIYTQLSAPGVARSNNTTNGSTGSQWKSEVDGNNADNRGSFRPDEEAISEVRTFTVNAPAEFQSSSTALGVSRGGTNRYHGTARIDIGNTDLNALGPFGDVTRGPGVPTVQQDYNVGGPIFKNRTFFNLTYADSVSRYNNFTSGYVYPTQTMRSGDLSIIPTPIIDPYTGQPFANNVIPSNLISPISQKLIEEYFPLPNHGPSNDLTDNYAQLLTSVNRQINWHLRLDHQFTPKHRVYFSWSRVYYDQVFPDNTSLQGAPPDDPDPRIALDRSIQVAHLYTFADTYVVAPSIVNEFTFGINQSPDTSTTGQLQGSQVLQDLGLNLGGRQIPSGIGFPNVAITGFTGVASRSGFAQTDEYQQYTFRDAVSIARGNHLFRVGVQIRNNRPRVLTQGPGTWGQFNFDGSFSGNAFADFLLGLPYTTAINRPRIQEVDHWSEYGIFVQDTWKVRDNLTLELGLRNQIYTIPYDANGLFYNFDPVGMRVVVPNSKALQSVVTGYPLPVVTAKTAGFPDKLMRGAKLGLEPRIGIAWRLSDKTVFRTGYGVYSVPPAGIGALLGSQATGPFTRNESFGPNQITNGVPLMTFSSPFPGAPGVLGLQSVTAQPVNFTRPYTQQWNVTFEREIPWKMAVSAAYVGTSGTHLAYTRDINRPPASLNPYQRVYDGYNAINVVDYGGNSIYNSLQVGVTRQFSSGLYLRASYERDQFLGNVSSKKSMLYGGPSLENPYDRRSYWGSYDGFEPDTLKINLVYTLPFGEGHRFFASNRVASAVLGGWTLSTYIFQSAGQLFTPTFSGEDTSHTGITSGRAQIVPGCNPGGQIDKDHWFNKSCFTRPDDGTFGNAPIGGLRGPAWWMQNAAIYKDISLGEWRTGLTPKLRLEMQSWDPLNHPTQRSVSMNINAANFGYAPLGSTDGMTTGWRYVTVNLGLSF
jgi:carboxypeptidase family protein